MLAPAHDAHFDCEEGDNLQQHVSFLWAVHNQAYEILQARWKYGGHTTAGRGRDEATL